MAHSAAVGVQLAVLVFLSSAVVIQLVVAVEIAKLAAVVAVFTAAVDWTAVVVVQLAVAALILQLTETKIKHSPRSAQIAPSHLYLQVVQRLSYTHFFCPF